MTFAATPTPRFYTHDDYAQYAASRIEVLSQINLSEEKNMQAASDLRRKIDLLNLFRQIVQSYIQGFRPTTPPRSMLS